MILIKKISFVFAFGVSVLSYSQSIETKAKNILDAVSSNYKSKKNVYFKFNYKIDTNSENKVGVFFSSKNKYRIKVLENEQIFDGNKIYNINEEEKEITIAKPTSDDVLLSPMSYLDSYKKGYSISYMGKKNKQDVVKLIPMKKNGIKQVLLYINTSKNRIEKIEQYAKNTTSITVTEYKENIKIVLGMFSFNKNFYKDYFITEL